MRLPVLPALLAGLLVAACATVPVTGRSQLMLVSAQEEARLGAAAFQQLAQEETGKGRAVSPQQDPALYQRVRAVGDRIIRAAGLEGTYQWDYLVIRSPDANAAAIAGGKIIVYTGILPIVANDAGLAVVLGHEVGHVLAHHTGERLSQAGLTEAAVGATAAALTGGTGGGATGQAVMAVFGLGAQYGVLLPYARAQESEADHIGLILMAKAGYDPREAVGLWQRMEQRGGSSPPQFLSTHPSHGTRIAQLQQWMPEALRYHQNPTLPLPGAR
jgi:predicted Zn-dependent protease